MSEQHTTVVKFCPFCGSSAIKHVSGVPRCTQCLAVFFVQFGRWYVKKSQQAPNADNQ